MLDPGQCVVCNICNTKYTDEIHYKIHLGTKKHKRNLREARGAVYEKEFGEFVEPSSADGGTSFSFASQGSSNQLPLDVSHISAFRDYKGKRETYGQKNKTYFEGDHTNYVSSAVAYWAVNLSLNPTVQDFKISISDRKWEDFGDAVVEIQFKDLPEKPASSARCAVHFKRIVSSNVKVLDSFHEGRFSFEGFVKQVGKIEGPDEKQIDDTRFFVFTTSSPSPSLNTAITIRCCQICCRPVVICRCSDSYADCQEEVSVYAKTLSNRRNLILNTSGDNESVYRFFPENNTYNLPKIYVYSCQKKLRDFPGTIEEIVCDSFGELRVQIAKDFIKYITTWGKGKCGGFYKLKKEDVLAKLSGFLLNPYRVTPQFKASEEPMSRFTIWIQAVRSVDITILKHSDDLSTLLEPYNLLIEKELCVKMNTTDNTIRILRTKEKDDTKNIEDEIVRAYINEETLRDFDNNIPLEMLYLIFWKAGLMPLVLEVEDELEELYVFRIINELKNFGLFRRYFVRTHDGRLRTPMKTLKRLSFFVNLGDISDKLGNSILANIRVGVTDSFSISLANIEDTDIFFKKSVCVNEFFGMTLGKYIFKYYSHNVGQKACENIKLTLENQLMTTFKRELESNLLVQDCIRSSISTNSNWLHGVNPNRFM